MENTKRDITLSRTEAEEYCAYKRQKKISEITSAFRFSESVLTAENAERVCMQAARLRQSAVRVTPSGLLRYGGLFRKNGVKLDCFIGGNGDGFPKVKAYEAKKAIRAGAGELTLLLNDAYIVESRYQELKTELRRVRRAAGEITLKARVERPYPQASLARLIRLCKELKIRYFSLPYFEGCERAVAELSGGCLLEVSDVDTLPLFKQMTGAGVGRIVTSRAWAMYEEWIKEAEEITVEGKLLSAGYTPNFTLKPPPKTEEASVEKTEAPPPQEKEERALLALPPTTEGREEGVQS